MELVGLSEIAGMLLTRKQQAYRWSRRPDFPAPVARLRQGPIWYRADVVAWARERGYTGVVEAESDRGTADVEADHRIPTTAS